MSFHAELGSNWKETDKMSLLAMTAIPSFPVERRDFVNACGADFSKYENYILTWTGYYFFLGQPLFQFKEFSGKKTNKNTAAHLKFSFHKMQVC